MRVLLVSDLAFERPQRPQIAAALREQGCEIVSIVNTKKNHFVLGGRSMWHYSRLARLLLAPVNNFIVNYQIVQQAKRVSPDLIFLVKCENVYWRTVRWLRHNTSAKVINWDHDNPFFPNNTSMELLRSFPYLHIFATIAEYLIVPCQVIGCERVEYAPMFYDPVLMPADAPITSQERELYQCEVCFIGGWSPEREAVLQSLTDFDLAIWGTGWDQLPVNSVLRRHCRHRALRGEEYSKALRCAKIGLNILNRSNWGASNLRTFETTGLGMFLLTEYSREQAERLFAEDNEIVCYRSTTELVDKARYYLNHAPERARIARNGQARTLREHTLNHRIRHLIEAVENLPAA